eukprot:scaffold1935_cov223-Skeletonema_marinoi.AAC.3
MTTFTVKVNGKLILHHRLVAIMKDHYGFGFCHNHLIKEYLQLKDGETFEDVERFKYRQDLSDRAVELSRKRSGIVKKKKWNERKLAKWSDVDHLLGRSKRWKNSDFFCMHVSHSWNQAMSYVRIVYGDWLYAFTNISYGSGSD